MRKCKSRRKERQKVGERGEEREEEVQGKAIETHRFRF